MKKERRGSGGSYPLHQASRDGLLLHPLVDDLPCPILQYVNFFLKRGKSIAFYIDIEGANIEA
jgi:hypothetical protein